MAKNKNTDNIGCQYFLGKTLYIIGIYFDIKNGNTGKSVTKNYM